MKRLNIFKSASLFSLSLAIAFLLSACGGGEKESATSQTGDVAYPEDKVIEDTNLDDDKPLELDSEEMSLEKKKLLATLNKQRTELENQIRQLEDMPGNYNDTTTLAGNIEKMKQYLDKLDTEIAQVKEAGEENFDEAAETAQAAIEGAGALMNSKDMRIN